MQGSGFKCKMQGGSCLAAGGVAAEDRAPGHLKVQPPRVPGLRSRVSRLRCGVLGVGLRVGIEISCCGVGGWVWREGNQVRGLRASLQRVRMRRGAESQRALAIGGWWMGWARVRHFRSFEGDLGCGVWGVRCEVGCGLWVVGCGVYVTGYRV